MDDYRSSMEPEVLQNNFHSDADLAAVSIAISLKRIAEVICDRATNGENLAQSIHAIAHVLWNKS